MIYCKTLLLLLRGDTDTEARDRFSAIGLRCKVNSVIRCCNYMHAFFGQMDIHVHAICIVAFIKWSRNISLHFLFNIIFSACIV